MGGISVREFATEITEDTENAEIRNVILRVLGELCG